MGDRKGPKMRVSGLEGRAVDTSGEESEVSSDPQLSRNIAGTHFHPCQEPNYSLLIPYWPPGSVLTLPVTRGETEVQKQRCGIHIWPSCVPSTFFPTQQALAVQMTTPAIKLSEA